KLSISQSHGRDRQPAHLSGHPQVLYFPAIRPLSSVLDPPRLTSFTPILLCCCNEAFLDSLAHLGSCIVRSCIELDLPCLASLHRPAYNRTNTFAFPSCSLDYSLFLFIFYLLP